MQNNLSIIKVIIHLFCSCLSGTELLFFIENKKYLSNSIILKKFKNFKQPKKTESHFTDSTLRYKVKGAEAIQKIRAKPFG